MRGEEYEYSAGNGCVEAVRRREKAWNKTNQVRKHDEKGKRANEGQEVACCLFAHNAGHRAIGIFGNDLEYARKSEATFRYETFLRVLTNRRAEADGENGHNTEDEKAYSDLVNVGHFFSVQQ